ncbi:MAG: hypothetical protein COB15_10020 [Flavobacteriales bacterium]|nr:MAG: hypothetical protein COB15_10020 [Flavobacteriales bacterium]
MKNVILLIIIASLLTSCFKLDDNLFNPDSEIVEYKLDNYTGEQDFVLDASYAIPSNLINVFTLNSQAPSESVSTTIYAIYIGDVATINTDTVIMYCHGNKWHMDFYWQRAKLLAHSGGKNNYGVMMVDYRGYGLSEGKPSEDGMYADVDAALNWLKQNGLSNDRLIMYGFSLGTAPVCELTAKPRSLTPSKLILEAPYASVAVMVQDAAVLGMPSSFVTGLSIDNAEEIKSVNQPLMWIHGEDDSFLNINTHGQVVYDNHQGVYKEAHKINGADHSEVPLMFGFQNYCSALDLFIKK